MTQNTPMSIRASVDMKLRLERAAAADHRSTSSLITTILMNWLDGRHYGSIPAKNEPESASEAVYVAPPGRRRSLSTRGIDKNGDPFMAKLLTQHLAGKNEITIAQVLDGPLKSFDQPFVDKAVATVLHELGWAEFIKRDGAAKPFRVWISPAHPAFE